MTTGGGWPDRTSRSAIGPRLVDERRVANPTQELGAKEVGLAFWQVAGMCQSAPKAFLLVIPSQETDSLLAYGALAWVDRTFTATGPPFPNFSVVFDSGDPVLVFDAQVLNRDGELRPLSFSHGVAGAVGDVQRRGKVIMVDELTAKVVIQTRDGSHSTEPFGVALW